MNNKLKDQYNEIFRYLGEKFGLPKLTFEHYQRLNKDDVRKYKMDKYIHENLPIEKSEDEELKSKVNGLNDNLRKEDKITDSASFFNLGEKMYPTKDNNTKKESSKNEVKKENKSSKKNVFKAIMKNIPKGALLTSAISIASFIGTRMLGTYAGWPMATMIGTANLTLLIPHAVILTYVGARFIKNRIKDGSFKRLIQKLKNNFNKNEKNNNNSKTNIKEKTAPIPESFIKGNDDVIDEYSDVPDFENKPLEENSNIPDFENKEKTSEEPQIPVFEKPVRNNTDDYDENVDYDDEVFDTEVTDSINNDDTNEPVNEETRKMEPIETTFVDKEEPETTEEFDEKENPVENNESEVVNETSEQSLNNDTKPVENIPTRAPKHAKKNTDENEKELLEQKMQLLEWKLEQLNVKSKLPETEEQTLYVENMKNQIKNELKQCREKHKKYEERNLGTQLRSKKANLVKKLNNIEKNENNKELISNIEIAIEQINNYLKLEELEKQGLITKEQLEAKASNAFMVSDFVLEESKKGRK